MSENIEKIYQNLWDEAKNIYRKIYSCKNAYIKKEEF